MGQILSIDVVSGRVVFQIQNNHKKNEIETKIQTSQFVDLHLLLLFLSRIRRCSKYDDRKNVILEWNVLRACRRLALFLMNEIKYRDIS